MNINLHIPNPFRRRVIIRTGTVDPLAAMKAELVNKQAQREAVAKQIAALQTQQAALDSDIGALIKAIGAG